MNRETRFFILGIIMLTIGTISLSYLKETYMGSISEWVSIIIGILVIIQGGYYLNKGLK